MADIYFLIIALLFSGFFSGMEIAYLRADKLNIELQRKKGKLNAKILFHFISSPGMFLGTLLIGNTISLVIYGILAIDLMNHFHLLDFLPDKFQSQSIIVPLQTVISTFFVLITAEFLPKSFFRINPSVLLKVFCFPMWIIYIILYPVVFVIVFFSKTIIVRVLKFKYIEEQLTFNEDDLDSFIRNNLSQNSKTSEINTQILKKTIDFRDTKVKECMVPRTEIVAVDVKDSMENVMKVFIKSNLSKILVYRNSIDNVIGYIHTLDFFKKPSHINQIIYPILIVPETYYAKDLLNQFNEDRKSIALIVDEYGGTAGLVTMEDIVEEILGEIEDEYDENDVKIEKKIDENTFIFDARIEIDYINEKYHFKIPEGEYETLGGYIISIHENIPEINEIIEIYPLLFEILGVSETKINKVKVTLID